MRSKGPEGGGKYGRCDKLKQPSPSRAERAKENELSWGQVMRILAQQTEVLGLGKGQILLN